MRIALCIDKIGGMLFNNRRLSQDRILCEKLLSLLKDEESLWVNEYSAKLFEDTTKLKVDSCFLEKAQEKDICFIETQAPSLEQVDELLVFCWNRQYPADTFFTLNPITEGFKKIKVETFEGFSHKKITLTIYRRA